MYEALKKKKKRKKKKKSQSGNSCLRMAPLKSYNLIWAIPYMGNPGCGFTILFPSGILSPHPEELDTGKICHHYMKVWDPI